MLLVKGPVKTKKYDTILFDMDGTVIDSDVLLFEIFNRLYDKFKNGQRKTKEEVYYFSGPPIRETLRKEFPDMDNDFMNDQFHEIGYPLYDTCIFNFPHGPEVFKKLKDDGFKLGIVTNKQHYLTVHALEILGIDQYFDVIVGLNDVKQGKPNREGIDLATKLLDGKKVIYVGDNYTDYLTATNAGIDCCLVNWGPRVLPKEATSKYKMNTYLDLLEFVYE